MNAHWLKVVLSIVLIVVLALGIVPFTGAQEGDAEANKALLRRYIEEFHNQQKADTADEILGDDFILHMAEERELDSDGVKSLFGEFWLVCNQPQWTILTAIAERALVAGTYTWDGCNTKLAGVTVLTMRDGKIVEAWDIWDTAQMGLEPWDIDFPLGVGSPEENRVLVADLLANPASITEGQFAEGFKLYLPRSEFGDAPYDLVRSAEWAAQIMTAFPDIRLLPYGDRENFVIVAEGDLVAAVLDVQYTFENEYAGMLLYRRPAQLQPNGNGIRFTAIAWIRISENQITDIWLNWDTNLHRQAMLAAAQ